MEQDINRTELDSSANLKDSGIISSNLYDSASAVLRMNPNASPEERARFFEEEVIKQMRVVAEKLRNGEIY